MRFTSLVVGASTASSAYRDCCDVTVICPPPGCSSTAGAVSFALRTIVLVEQLRTRMKSVGLVV